MIAYLWDAGRWCGISGSRESAQVAAAGHLGDSGARVEEVWPVDAAPSTMRVYEPTGRSWTAQRDAGGVSWTPAGMSREERDNAAFEWLRRAAADLRSRTAPRDVHSPVSVRVCRPSRLLRGNLTTRIERSAAVRGTEP